MTVTVTLVTWMLQMLHLPKKKTALEVLLGNSFSENPVTFVTITFTEIVMAEVSRYKCEPLLPLKMKISEWWRSHSPSYPNYSITACFPTGSNYIIIKYIYILVSTCVSMCCLRS